MALDSISSAGLGGTGPDGAYHKFSTGVLTIISLNLFSPTRKLLTPLPLSMLKILTVIKMLSIQTGVLAVYNTFQSRIQLCSITNHNSNILVFGLTYLSPKKAPIFSDKCLN
jgi:hypothetical protein